MKGPIVLLILDGWGIADDGPGNAITQAQLTTIPKLWNLYPHTKLAASGEAVGLPSGEDGNTETGHINIGAGRIVYQDFPRINMSIEDGSFFGNEVFLDALHHAVINQSNLHIMGLVSDSAVHASLKHLYALLALIKNYQHRPKGVYLHLFTDGRDSRPDAGIRFVADVEAMLTRAEVGHVATIMGRYYAMDRDRRWERTERAYQALTEQIPNTAKSSHDAIANSYAKNVTDEFVEPTVILDGNGKPYPRIGNGDAVIFYNFRIDRPRQLTRAFVLPNFESSGAITSFDPYTEKYYHKHIIEENPNIKPFHRTTVLANLYFVTMTEYEKNFPCHVAYPLQTVNMPLGRVMANADIRQLRIAETEKERFVTYYFNGMRDNPFLGEDWLIVPSAKVPTYDLKPEMSAAEITEKCIAMLMSDTYVFFVVNFANADIVAHTGNIHATIKACQTVDTCVGKIVQQVLMKEGTCFITADHGNAEELLGPHDEVDTEHSSNYVPFIIVNQKFHSHPLILPSGKLADIAPTILSCCKMQIPTEMTGVNLFQNIRI